MSTPVILNYDEVMSVLDMRSVIEGVERAYAYKSSGRARLFPLICHSFQDGAAEFDIKSGSIDAAGIFGMKLVTYFSGNSQLGLPVLSGTVLIFNRSTGQLEAVMDGARITNMRTGAAGAVGAKHLARANSRRLLMVGAGTQAINLIMATMEVMESIEKVTVHDPLSFEKACQFAGTLRERMMREYVSRYQDTPYYERLKARLDIEYAPSGDLQAACGEADIILTATPSRKALIMSDWVKPGTHLSCIGADMEGKQELDEALLGRSRVFADDISQVLKVGECEKAYRDGILKQADITEIGQVILGAAPGRVRDDDITIFDSTGIAIQDLITAQAVLKRSVDRRIGTRVQI